MSKSSKYIRYYVSLYKDGVKDRESLKHKIEDATKEASFWLKFFTWGLRYKYEWKCIIKPEYIYDNGTYYELTVDKETGELISKTVNKKSK